MGSEDAERPAQSPIIHSRSMGCEGSSRCPGLDIVAAFLEDGLSGDEGAAFERHLVHCSLCRDRVLDITVSSGAYEQQPLSLPLHLRQRVLKKVAESRQRTIAQLVYHASREVLEQVMGSGEVLQLQPVPVRGGKFPSAYRVSLDRVEVEVATDRRKDGTFDIWLRANPAQKGLYRCEWQLWEGNQLNEQQPSDNGEGIFTRISSGHYQCVLNTAGQEVGIVDITLHEGKDS